MLPKPKFDLTPRQTSVNVNSAPQRTWFQYNPNQSFNHQFVKNNQNYGQNYSNNNYQSFSNNLQPLWHQNNYNSSHNLNVNNVWNGFSPQNNIGFTQSFGQNYGNQQHFQRNDCQNKRFKDNNHKNFNNNSNKKTYNCETCCRWFQTEELYNQHLNEHIVCGLDECKFRAHPKVIESHQRMQHFCFRDRTVVKKFMNLETEEDIEKWKEERKRNFPTKDNIKKKQEIKEKLRLEAIEEKNRLKQIEDKQKLINEKRLKQENDKCFDEKSKRNRKPSKGKGRQKPIDTFKRTRKLTLFQKLMMNEIQEENEEKVDVKVEQQLQ